MGRSGDRATKALAAKDNRGRSKNALGWKDTEGFLIAGMRIFGASNGAAKRTAKSILEAITTNKIKIVDERHRIKHKATEKPKLAAEIKTLWTELDKIKRKTSTSEEAPQRMSIDELAEHIKPMKIRKIEE